MAIDYSVFDLPKGESRKRLKARKQREDAKQLKAFRKRVWEREALWDLSWTHLTARCQRCACMVHETMEPRGEVHHIIGRRNKATRYDPANGQLLCRECHRAVQEHRA